MCVWGGIPIKINELAPSLVGYRPVPLPWRLFQKQEAVPPKNFSELRSDVKLLIFTQHRMYGYHELSKIFCNPLAI